MKKVLFSVAALALTAGSALAADLPSRKAEPVLPPPPTPPMWTGFYAGLNAGYGFGTNDNSQSVGFAPPIFAGSAGFFVGRPVFAESGLGRALSSWTPNNQSGFIGGGQIGYNYQWGSSFLIGFEADIQGTGIRGGTSGVGVGSGSPVGINFLGLDRVVYSSSGITSVNSGVDWLGTVRGRLGYLWSPTMLIYASGGLTYGGVYGNVRNYAIETQVLTPFFQPSQVSNATYFGGGSRSETRVGWNAGGGLEWMFMPNWSIKAEGIYWNMGSQNILTSSLASAINPTGVGTWGTIPAVAIAATRVNYQGVIARMGVNYHFNFGGAAPVVAKY